MSVIDLGERRRPVSYTVRLTQHWDGSVEVFVEDVADDERSRQSVAYALMRAADAFGGEDKDKTISALRGQVSFLETRIAEMESKA